MDARRVRVWALGSMLAGCAVGPDFKRPDAPAAQTYSPGAAPTITAEASGVSQRFDPNAKIKMDWWRLFGSPEINDIVGACLLENPTLEAGRASILRSRELLAAGYGIFLPQVDAQAGASYQRSSALRLGQNVPTSDFGLYSLGATVSYTIDIWGGERRNVESLAAQVEAQRYTLASIHVMLTANVVNAVIARAAYYAQVEATNSIVDFEKEQLRITEAQAGGGTVPYANVLSIKSQLAATRATVPALAQRIDEADRLLATLTGHTPDDWHRAPVPLADIVLPREIPMSLPSVLVRQRPDILVAEAELHAANAQIGVATAAMLPNLTLTAGAGANNAQLAQLFSPNGIFANAAAGLTAPIFHGGSLSHQRKAAIAARDQAFALYKQTVLSAFEQVGDSLGALAHDAEALDAESEAVLAADQALRLVQTNYLAGIATYLQVITANEQDLQAKTAFISAFAQRLQDTVALYVALGGGWWDADLEPPRR